MATNALIFGSPSPAVQARFGVSQPTDDLDAALQCDLVKVPKVVFAIREYQLPLTDAQLDDMVEFLKWTNGVNTENWPPNIEG